MVRPAPASMVLLRHETPDGGRHFDFMVQLNGPGAGLHTWRVEERVHELVIGEYGASFSAEPLGEHREVYLTYQGEISGGRGRVSRAAEGVVHLPHPATVVTTERVVFEATWWTGPNRGRLRYCGLRDGGGGWLFSVVAAG